MTGRRRPACPVITPQPAACGLPPLGDCDTIGLMPNLTSLYLAPADVEASPAREPVIRVLRDLDIIGEAIAPDTFNAANGFSRHVVYAGCSPYLVMQPPADGSRQFCHVAVHGPFARPRLVTGPNTVKPRCPACRARFDDWRAALPGWQRGDTRAECPGCGRSWPAYQLDWRGHAIAARMLIELRNVFPAEANPSDLLLHSLQEATGTDWHYAWAGYLDDPHNTD